MFDPVARSRRRKAARPAAASSTAAASSQTRGVATKSAAGSRGRWANGDRSWSRWPSRSGSPNMVMDSTTARMAQVAPTASRGASPNRATPMAAITQTAGSWTSAPPRTLASWPPTSPARRPWASPASAPPVASTTAAPPAATSRWLPAQPVRDAVVASTGSARCSASSARSRRVAWTA